ncbi:unnamed protein product, partial [Brassica rapa subsp. trilocularis]
MLNRDHDGHRSTVPVAENGSRHNYFLDGRNHGEELTNLYGQQILDSYDTRWISQPFSTPDLIEQRNLHRAISYPEPQHHQRPHQHQQQFSSEPIILPNSSGGDRKISMLDNQIRKYHSGGLHMGFPNLSPLRCCLIFQCLVVCISTLCINIVSTFCYVPCFE